MFCLASFKDNRWNAGQTAPVSEHVPKDTSPITHTPQRKGRDRIGRKGEEKDTEAKGSRGKGGIGNMDLPLYNLLGKGVN